MYILATDKYIYTNISMDGFISGIKNPVDMPGLDCPWHGIHVNVVSWLIGFLRPAHCAAAWPLATCYIVCCIMALDLDVLVKRLLHLNAPKAHSVKMSLSHTSIPICYIKFDLGFHNIEL